MSARCAKSVVVNEGGPDNLLSGFARILSSEQEVVADSRAKKASLSCGAPGDLLFAWNVSTRTRTTSCPGHPHAARSGFTLLEMMMTLAVFILLVAAVFTLMTGTIESASTLQDNSNRKDQTSALEAYLKRQITSLPVASTIVSYQRGDGEGLVQNGVVYGTVNLATAIDGTIQPNGLYTLRVANLSTGAATSGSETVDARQSLIQSVTTNDPALVWTSLMKDIKTIDWKFLDFNQTQWVELWGSGTKPNLVEFDFQPAGDLNGTTFDFWVPKIDPVPQGGAAGAGGAGRGGTGTGTGGEPRARPTTSQKPTVVP